MSEHSSSSSARRREQLRARLRAEGFRAAAADTNVQEQTTGAKETTDQRILGRLIANAGAAGMLTWAFPLPLGPADSGSPDVQTSHKAFREAIAAVVERRPELRTAVQATEAGLQRTVLPAEAVFTPAPGEPTEVAELAATPIDPTHQTPLRARFLPGVLVLSTHHVAADEHTWVLLLRELNAELAAPGALAGSPTPPLFDAPPALVAEATGRRVAALHTAISPDAVLPDPFAGERRLVADNSGQRLCLEVSAEWVANIQEQAKHAETTVLAVLIAAAARVLARRARTTQEHGGVTVVGTPADVRDALGAGAYESDGDRVSVVPVAVPVGASVSEVAGLVGAAVRDRAAGLDDVVRALGVSPGAGGRSPLVDVVVTHRVGTRELVVAGRTVRGEFVHSGASAFDAVLSFEQDAVGGAGRLAVEFRSAALRPATAGLLLEEWRDVAAGIAVEGDLGVGELPTTRSRTQDVVAAVADFARTRPDAVAVSDAESELSFAQLHRAATALACDFIRRGARPGDVVALRMNRGVRIPAAMLAALYAGTPFVCVDPKHPAKRSQLILDAARPVLLVEDADIDAVIAAPGTAAELRRDLPGQLPAYVVFTSGTTGTPKGIVVSRSALDEVLGAMREVAGLGEEDTYLAASTLGFDISIVESLLPLLAGARLYIAPPEFSTDISAACALLRRVRPTVVEATPSLWAEIAHHDSAAVRGIRACAGGEELSRTLATQLRDAGAEVFNLYGPSETAIVATAHRVSSNNPDTQPPLGEALPPVGAEIFDPLLRGTPDGALGELYLSGPQLAYGYLDNPVLTAVSFVAAPGGTRRYRTGDLVVRDVDTREIGYRGRGDEQLSLHGVRIERGEIEAALAAAPGVAAAAVHAEGDRVVGFVTADLAAPTEGFEQAVADFAAAVLPAVAHPAAVVQVPEFPRTATGKIDRARLPMPKLAATAHREPANPEEAAVVRAVSEVLSLDDAPSADADFRALGGHSLLAHRLALKLSAKLDTQVSVRTVLEEPNLAKLARAITRNETAPTEAASTAAADVPEVEADTPLPSQRRIVLAEQFDPTPGLYTIPLFAEVTGEIDPARLGAALTAVVAAHPVLRSVLSLDAGVVRVRERTAEEAASNPIVVQEYTTTEPNLESFLDGLVRTPLTAFDAHPLRAAVVKVLDSGRVVLALLFHHAFVDEWSLHPLFDDLALAYDGAELPERTPSFRHIQALANYPRPADVEFWTARALPDTPGDAAANTADLPFSRQALAAAGGASDIVGSRGPAIHLVAQFPELTSTLGPDYAADVVKAAVLVVLARAGLTPVVGIPVSGRQDASLADVVGYVGNTVPLHVAEAARVGVDTRELTRRVHDEVLDVAEHSSAAVEDVSGVPGFQVIVDHRVGAPPLPHGQGWETTLVPVVPVVPKFPLTVVHTEPGAEDTDTPHRVDLLFSGEVFESVGAQLLLETLRHTIISLAGGEGSVAGNLGSVALAEAATRAENPDSGFVSVPELLDQQFSAHRDETMLSDPEHALTGGQLRTQVNAIAAGITAHLGGKTAGQVVAIHHRSRYQEVLSILGVLASGAAFVVLRPDDPAERLSAILDDASVALIISDNPSSLPAGWPPALEIKQLTAVADTDFTPRWPQPEQPAYLVFTSGTTGRPKGVLVDHRAMAGLVDFTFTLMETADAEKHARPRLVSVAPMAFDVGLLEIVSTFCAGGHLYVAADTERIGAQLVAAVTRHRSTHFAATPTVLALVGNPTVLPEDVLIFSGAEPLPADLAARWAARHQVVNLYGPTEATVNAIHGFVAPNSNSGVVPIGIADPHVTAIVLDSALQPTPAGMVGELWLAGPKLALGYPAQPGLSATVFVAAPDHLGLAPGARMYRTGDLAARLPDGQLVCLGRIDDQMKIRGLRIEPAEIEAALRADSLVDNARVVRIPESMSGERDILAAAVVSAGGKLSAAQLGDIRQRAAKRLPQHLVPQRLVEVEGLPVTTNGKADRHTTMLMVADALSKASAEETTEVAATTEEPTTTSTEFSPAFQVLAEEVGELLGANPQSLSPDADFLELGGDSILALQLVARLQDRGWSAGARDIFDARTLGELADNLTAEHPDNDTAPELSDVEDIGTFTPVRVAAEHISAAPDSIFAQSMLLSVPPLLSGHTGMLVGGLVERHPALRTRVTDTSECETLAESTAYQGPPVALRGADAADGLAKLRRDLAEHLDPRAGVLLAACEVDTDHGPMLLLVAHHNAVDAASWVQLIADMNALISYGLQHALDFTDMPGAAGTSPRAGSVHIAETTGLTAPTLPVLRSRITEGAVTDEDVAATAKVSTQLISQETTAALVARFGHGLDLRDALLMAVARAVRAVDPWGPGTVTVDVEDHGRSGVIDPRSVGWWTQITTAVINGNEITHLPAAQGPVPPEQRSDIVFNHLGAMFQTAPENPGTPEGMPRVTPAQAPDLPTLDTIVGDDVPLRNALSLTTVITPDERLQVSIIHGSRLVPVGVVTQFEAALTAEIKALAGGTSLSSTARRVPVTPTQEGMFYLEEQGDPGVAAYLTRMKFTLDGELDPEAVLAAWARLLRTHPGLQTRFSRTTNGEVIAIIDPQLPVDARHDDAYTDADMLGGFDITTGPLARLRIKQLSGTRHVIDVVFHHILVDGWSAPLLVRDFFALLDPEHTLEVVDPTPVLSAITGAGAQAATRDVLPQWRKALRAAKPTLLAAGGVDAGTRTELRISIDAATSQALAARAKEEHLTVAALIHGAWARVLGELTGQDKVSFGSVVSGRPLDVPAAQNTVGLFATTVPIAVGSAQTTRADVYAPAREASELLMLGAHNPPPLATAQRLVESTTTQLFDSLLVIENYPLDQAALFDAAHGLTLTDMSFQDGTHYPIMVVAHIGEEISLRLATAEGVELVGGAQVADLADSLQRHLRTLAGTTLLADRITGIPIVDVDGTRLDAHHTTAVVHTLAQQLRACNIGPGDHVAIALPRGATQLCTTLATWLVGAAAMPIEVDFTGALTRRGADIIAAAKPALVVDMELYAQLNDTETVGEFHVGDRTRALTAADPAYVVHTSGTTGTPKGVVVPWQVMEELIAWQRDAGIIPTAATLAHYAPDQFDVSFQELLTAVAGGHPIVVVSNQARRDMVGLARLLDAEGVDVLFATSTVLNALAREFSHSGKPSLSVLVQAGEALRPGRELRAWCAAPAGPALYNQYGPSETHVVLATGNLAGSAEEPTLGTALPHVTALVLDEDQQPVSAGKVGELYIAGALAEGYLGDPELTALAFPTDIAGHERLHRTGDLVRRRVDGEFEYVGRTDDQLKIRGVRVSPAEVEVIARGCAGVVDAVAVAVDGVLGVVAVSTPEAGLSPDVLRQHFTAQLGAGGVEAALIPDQILLVDALPVTDNAKTDLRAVRELLRSGGADANAEPQVGGASTSTTSASAELVATIMADVLREQDGVDVTVGADDDFLALGGHSLSGTRLAGRISTALGAAVSLRTILEQRTPRAIADAVAAGTAGTPGLTEEEFAQRYEQHVPTPGVPAPVTAAQRRFWALSRVNPEDVTYNLPLLVRLSPNNAPTTDCAATVTRGLRGLVARHESLRTLLVGDIDGPRQLVLAAQDAAQRLDVPVVDSEAELSADRARPFRLDTDLPIRAALYTESDGNVLLSLVIHHSACDGWSLPILMNDLNTLWRTEQAPEAAPSAAAIMAVRQDVWQETGQAERDHDYWVQQLADLPTPMPLPLDRPRNPQGTTRGNLIGVELDEADLAALTDTARALDATPFMVFHAAVATMLHRLGCGDDIVLATPVSGRLGGVDETAVGCFVNLLVLRTQLAGNPTFREVVGRVRSTNLQATEHSSMPFDVLVRELAAGGSKAHPPLATVGIGVQNLPAAFPAPKGYTAQVVPTNPEVSRFDINFEVFFGTDDLGPQLVAEYDANLFDEATITRMISRIIRILHTAATSADTAIHGLPVLLDDERANLRRATDTVATPSEAVAALVRGVVAEGSAALSAGESWVGTDQLRARVDALAGHLAARGIGPGDVVGILCRRNLGQLIAQLAVLRTGAAYAPMLPELPAQRLAVQVTECGITTALCTNIGDAHVPETVTLIAVGEDAASISGEQAPLPALSDIPSAAPAYVLFTSGSTGTPKGVLVTRGNVEALLTATAHTVPLNANDVLLALSPFAFDVTGWEYLAPMAAGARLVIANEEQFRDPRRILELMDAHEVTCCEATPGLWSLIADAATGGRAGSLAGVRAVISGEELPASVATAVAATGAQVWNLYGPTEATVFATAGAQNTEVDPVNIDIGTPLPGVQIRVLDDYLVPVPDGAIGDLYLVGPQIADGYIGRPELSATVFVADPLAGSQDSGSVMYRTGDQVRRMPDGRLLYLGRRDQQVQIRGHRVELGDVVSALLSLPEVRKAAAKVLQRGSAKTLVGYVVVDSVGVELDRLLQQLRTLLPDYLIPAQLVQLADMPLTANGKVDVRALPDPEPEQWQAPETETEKILAGIVADLLDSDIPGRNQGFIALGGDSITAIRLAARAAEAGLPVTVQDVLIAGTIAELGAIADSRPADFLAEGSFEAAVDDSADLSGLDSDELSQVLDAFGEDFGEDFGDMFGEADD